MSRIGRPIMQTSLTLLLLSSLLGLLSSVARTTEAAPEYLYHVCSDTTSFNPNSIYETNLNLALSALSSNATRDTGFYNVTAGRTSPDIAYALFLCRGDVTSQACQDCVAIAVNETVRQQCRGLKVAITWYDQCMLRYSNVSFFSQVSQVPAISMYNTQNITEPSRFNQLLLETLNSIRTEAANDQSGKKYATKEENFTGFQSLYTLLQCTPDLSPDQCNQCLVGTIASLPNCCTGRQGGRVLTPSCNVRFEVYPFYTEPASPTSPPPLAPPNSVPTTDEGIFSVTKPIPFSSLLVACVSVDFRNLIDCNKTLNKAICLNISKYM